MFNKSKSKGMTLIEMMVYVGIISLLLVIVVETLTTVTRTYRATSATRSINVSGMTALERIMRDIRNADSVDQAQSLLDSNPGKLVLLSGGTTTEFYTEGGLIKVRENGVSRGTLIGGTVTTTSLVFRLVTTPKSSAAKVEMTIEAGSGPNLRSSNFYGTAVLRNSY